VNVGHELHPTGHIEFFSGCLRYKIDLQSLQGEGAFDDEEFDLDDY